MKLFTINPFDLPKNCTRFRCIYIFLAKRRQFQDEYGMYKLQANTFLILPPVTYYGDVGWKNTLPWKA